MLRLQYPLIAFRSKLSKRPSVIEGRKPASEVGQLRDLPAVLVLSATTGMQTSLYRLLSDKFVFVAAR
uniref:Uncharacterized protein n=1 Tax=Ixodes ricinus TaxID=34613 RepID=A0A6B0U1I8_IXORI